MNNSQISFENALELETQVDNQPRLREQATELTEIIESLDKVTQSNYWKVLQKKIFDGILSNLYSRIKNEKDTTEIFRLQGQIVWAEKFADITKLTDVYRSRLANVKKQLQ